MKLLERLSSFYRNGSAVIKGTLLFIVTLLTGAYISYRLIDTGNFSLWKPQLTSTAAEAGVAPPSTNTITPTITSSPTTHLQDPDDQNILQCESSNLAEMCLARRRSMPPKSSGNGQTKSPSCPEYFRWIHEDLRPWEETGITKDIVERANKTANFRLVVVNGTAYVHRFSRAFQTRDVFTWWGILQLLRRYPSQVPDLDLMFDCDDRPVVKAADYQKNKGVVPPPLFHYSSHNDMLDIVFPDWSFWGWPEINIKPWEPLLEDFKNGNERIKWSAREPFAFWKGNFYTGATRLDLLKCNKSKSHEWNARLFAQDWGKESHAGFKHSDLGSQCDYRYKIYIEGWAWSVSEKYILACNSPTLFVEAQYYDFFTRGLMPMHHYWPIRNDNKCRAIKFAVNWGNSHPQEAQEMGKASSTFIREELKMEYIYDYMLHLLTEYAKLLKYKPAIPENAFELCLESMACPARGLEKKYMVESMVKEPAKSSPCTLPPPFNPLSLQEFQERNKYSIKQVEMWENEACERQKKQH